MKRDTDPLDPLVLLDRVLSLDSAPLILQILRGQLGKTRIRAADLAEGMALRDELAATLSLASRDVGCVVLGDGPRFAVSVLLAFVTKWRIWSLDPRQRVQLPPALLGEMVNRLRVLPRSLHDQLREIRTKTLSYPVGVIVCRHVREKDALVRALDLFGGERVVVVAVERDGKLPETLWGVPPTRRGPAIARWDLTRAGDSWGATDLAPAPATEVQLPISIPAGVESYNQDEAPPAPVDKKEAP